MQYFSVIDVCIVRKSDMYFRCALTPGGAFEEAVSP